MLRRRKIGRILSAASAIGIALVLPFAAIFLNAIARSQTSLAAKSAGSFLESVWSSPWVVVASGAIFLVVLIIAVFQTRERYQRLTYDPTWVLKYQETFDEMENSNKRRDAAKTLRDLRECLKEIRKYRNKLTPIDSVLDFFDDLGLYVEGGQISPELAHHHFYHWIRGYYQCTREYIAAWQAEEPPRWEHFAGLFRITSEVETRVEAKARKRTGQAGGRPEDLDEFLREEIGDEEA